VAHDLRKQDLLKCLENHKAILVKHRLYANGTTGNLIHQASGILVQSMLSGPMGGDQQIGALIAEGKIDMLIFSGTCLMRCHTIQT